MTWAGSAFTELADTFNLILNTVSAPVPLPGYLGLLRLHGTMVNVGLTTEPMQPGHGRCRGTSG
ncbi:hypothetical protein [Streptomyces massasporeus]|uniref:hypothetical protein n=1 Tax=Streptomyces massasporeus TaxID=67324 RepID=UPI003650862E